MTKYRRMPAGVSEEVEQEVAGEVAGDGSEKPGPRKPRNNVRKIRESLLMSKAELARKSGLSALTIDRIESGYSCRMDTKRKIILALGLHLADKDRVFVDEGEPS